jgi:Na+/H+ antiporter NhaD/arsenite permease-like protein
MKENIAISPSTFSSRRTFVFGGLFVFLMIWSVAGIEISSFLSARLSTGYTDSDPAIDSFLLVLVAIMFIFLYRNFANRSLIVLGFAAKITLIGMYVGYYNLTDAFLAIKFDTLSLLLGMGLISAALDEAGMFSAIAGWIAKVGYGSGQRLIVYFCLITYGFSLLINNLSTIMVVVPMALRTAEKLGFDPRPLIIGVIIAANLGGASTMVGDFPNMLIASETGIGFNSFIASMMPACLILLAILLLYLTSVQRIRFSNSEALNDEEQMDNLTPEQTPQQVRTAERVLLVLGVVVMLLVLAEKFSLPPAAIALTGGFAALLCSGTKSDRVLARVGYGDILFFSGLFVVVGALESSGFLHYFSDLVLALSFGQPLAVCLILMWGAALITAFLNAGPTTAFFIPIVVGLGGAGSGELVWWSLSLGVLAGSSATIFGATAGPVSASLLENYKQTGDITSFSGRTISAQQFMAVGLPIALMFLTFSSFYIFLLYQRI